MAQMSHWMFWTGTNTKDLLAWTKCLNGRFGWDQMSCKAPVPPRPTESENTMGFGYMF